MSVDLVGPDGKQYHIESDDPAALAKAKSLGYRVGSDGASDTGGAVRSGVSGFMSGLTMGAADLVNAGGSEVERRDAEANAAEHPTARTIGELVGAVASPVNKVAAPFEAIKTTSAVGRLATKAAGGAAVGSLFGAGNTISDAALGDTQLTAEKLIAGSGLGSILGGAGGLLGGAVEEAASLVLPKASKLTGNAQGVLNDIANDAAVKSTRATNAEIQRIGEKNVDAMGQMLRDRGHLKYSPDEMLDSVTKDREATGKTVLKQLGLDVDIGHDLPQEEAQKAVAAGLDKYGGAIDKSLGDVDASAAFPGGARPIYSDVLGALDGLEASSPNPAARAIAKGPIDEARGYINEMASAPVNSPQNGFRALNSLKTTLMKDINYGGESGAKAAVKKQIARLIKEQVDSQLERNAGAAVSQEFINSKRAYGLLSRGEEALGRKTSTGADAIAEMAKGAGLDTPESKLFDLLGHTQALAGKGAGRAGGFGLKDIGAAVVGGGFHPGLGLVSAIASKFIREHGQAVLARAADAIAKSPVLATTAASMAKSIGNIAPNLGGYGPNIVQAFAQSAAHGLATHLLLSHTDPGYSATAQLAGMEPEGQEEHAMAMDKSTRLAGVAAAASAQDAEIDRHVANVFRGAGSAPENRVHDAQDFGAKRMRRDSIESHRQVADEAARLAADPSALAQRVAENAGRLGTVAPNIVAHLTDRANAAVQYLAREGGAPPKKGPLAPEHTPSQSEMHAFAQKAEVVRKPMSVMAHASAGTLTRAQVDALKAVYPTLARDIADRALMKMAESPKGVPYRARLMLSLLTGIDVDGTMSPQAIASNQAAIAGATGKPSEEMGQGNASADKLTVAKRTATPGERLEQRDPL